MDKISDNLQYNIDGIKGFFKDRQDLICKDILCGQDRLCVMYVVGLIDVLQTGDFLISPLLEIGQLPATNKLDYLKKEVLIFPEISSVQDHKTVVDNLLHGKVVLFIDGENSALSFALDKMKERAIDEPPTNAVLKGPRGGFVENYKTNLVLIKKILATENLKMKSLEVGEFTKTTISIVYIDGVCDKNIVDGVVRKIEKIKIDGIIDSFYIASFLEKYPYSIFKQIGNSEKPDVVCAKMLEGRLAIIVDGSPLVLTLPFIFVEDLQNSDDYYSNSVKATIKRILRIASILITLMLPAMYVAVQLYHYKVIPLTFIVSIINATAGIPLSPFAEILFVLSLFEILYEASLRMPKHLGIALSVVGALILGDTAVSAGLISPPAVMMVALSGITLYTVPDQTAQFTILRFAYTLIGGFLGLFGIIIFTIYLIFYLNDFDSYGSAYLAPFSPYIKEDFQDAVFKQDLLKLKNRPKSIKNKNRKRLG